MQTSETSLLAGGGIGFLSLWWADLSQHSLTPDCHLLTSLLLLLLPFPSPACSHVGLKTLLLKQDAEHPNFMCNQAEDGHESRGYMRQDRVTANGSPLSSWFLDCSGTADSCHCWLVMGAKVFDDDLNDEK